MNIEQQINQYLGSLPVSKKSDLQILHGHMLSEYPKIKLWFLSGTNEHGKVVSNPNIGYGIKNINYANGTIKEFYQIGFSANTTGISVYIMGIENKNYLPDTYGKSIGKASVTGYCIKFKSLKDIHWHILTNAINDGMRVK